MFELNNTIKEIVDTVSNGLYVSDGHNVYLSANAKFNLEDLLKNFARLVIVQAKEKP